MGWYKQRGRDIYIDPSFFKPGVKYKRPNGLTFELCKDGTVKVSLGRRRKTIKMKQASLGRFTIHIKPK